SLCDWSPDVCSSDLDPHRPGASSHPASCPTAAITARQPLPSARSRAPTRPVRCPQTMPSTRQTVALTGRSISGLHRIVLVAQGRTRPECDYVPPNGFLLVSVSL